MPLVYSKYCQLVIVFIIVTSSAKTHHVRIMLNVQKWILKKYDILQKRCFLNNMNPQLILYTLSEFQHYLIF